MNESRGTTGFNDLLASLASRDDDRLRNLRAAILVAHPDDEVLGAGSLLSRLHDVTIVHTTDGAPHDMEDARCAGFKTHEEYACTRRRELYAALELVRIMPRRTRALWFVDKELAHSLVPLTHLVVDLLRDLRPQVLLTHAYEGGHPDHDATAFAAQAACRLLRKDGATSPTRIEMPFYHNGTGTTQRGLFLPHDNQAVTITLTPEEQTLKQKMFDVYRSQQSVLCDFEVEHEHFRLAPSYDFTCPPHAGQLNYEMWGWQITGAQWRELAQRALIELGL